MHISRLLIFNLDIITTITSVAMHITHMFFCPHTAEVQGSSPRELICNSGLHRCSDNKCHECCSDSDCSGYDPNTHTETELVCDSPSGSYPRTSGSYTYTCKAKPSCSSNSDCDPGYCCDKLVGGTGKCVDKGIYSKNPKYLCDPPQINKDLLAFSSFNPFS